MYHLTIFELTLVFLVSLFISLFWGGSVISLLKKLSAFQFIREDGPNDHISRKSNTPTLGGVIFLTPLIIITLFLCLFKKNFQTADLLVVLSTTLLMGVLGFADDYQKIKKKHNKGISGWIKLFIQLLVSLILFFIYGKNLSFIYLLYIFFILAGSSNSYNLTDGLDGLLSSISIVSLLGFAFLFNYIGKFELVYFSIIYIGAIAGFLYYNRFPAKVFMGDTGSLAIGGAIGSLAIISKYELLLIFIAAVPILEAVSVILQVVSCKLSKKFLGVDKRIFKMSPLHHHFELCGWTENKIVTRFFLFQTVCLLIGITIFVLIKNKNLFSIIRL